VTDDDDTMTMIKTGVNGENSLQSVISGFRRGVNEIFVLLDCYAAWIDSYRGFGTTKRLCRNVGKYQSALRKVPEE